MSRPRIAFQTVLQLQCHRLRHPRMTTANKITITRILLIPLFVLMAIYYGRGVAKGEPAEWQRYAAIAIFVIAAASDGLDGYIARRYNQRSQLGVILDPIADKGLLLAALITLAVSNWHYELPLWFPVLIIARDVIVVTGAIVLHLLNGHLHVQPSWSGKVATALQMIALALVMLQLNWPLGPVRIGNWQTSVEFLDVPVYVAGFFTALSGFGYVVEGIRQLHASEHGKAKPPTHS
jgi:CDP-diacylglycerol--glycerol-3-phosphate 3-phosphatidyltransferase